MTLHSTTHTNRTSYENLLHAPMFMLIVNMSLQMYYSNSMAHMPSAYGLDKDLYLIKFNSVQIEGQENEQWTETYMPKSPIR